MKGQVYNASLSDGDWCVKGVDGYSYTTLRRGASQIQYRNLDGKVRFTFEPVEAHDEQFAEENL